MAVVLRALSLPGSGERLARESPSKEICASGGLVGMDVAMDGCAGPMLAEDGLAEGVELDELMLGIMPYALCREREAADAREKVEVAHT